MCSTEVPNLCLFCSCTMLLGHHTGLRRRGVALGVTSQLSGSIPSINMSGFMFGNGDNALLLGTNVIGAIVAWGLMAITLLENPFGSQLAQVSTLLQTAACMGISAKH